MQRHPGRCPDRHPAPTPTPLPAAAGSPIPEIEPVDPGPAPEIATANPSTGTQVELDEHRNVEKAPGEPAGLLDGDSGANYFTIEVTGATLATECEPRVGTTALKPTRAAFLVLDITASLESDFAAKIGGDPEQAYMPLVAEAFSVAAEGGKPETNNSSGTAWGCFEDAVLLPPVLNPGRTVSGKLVLDVASTSGRVAYDPQGNGGWSWPYGQ